MQVLDDEFDATAGGYNQLTTITDPYERAVVSDLIARSALGIADSLIEARLALGGPQRHRRAAGTLAPDAGDRA